MAVSSSRDDVESTSHGQDSQFTRRQARIKKKQRISRACDICHRRRVKCDGNTPCTRCPEPAVCTYLRGARKRGKPARNVRDDSGLSSSSLSDNDAQLQDDLRSLLPPDQIPDAARSHQRRLEPDLQASNPGQVHSVVRFDSTHYVAPELVASRGEEPPAMNSEFLPALAEPGMAPSNPLRDSPTSNTLRDLFPDQLVNQGQPTWESYAPNAAPAVGNVEHNNPIPQGLKYPVLKPLLPYTRSFLTASEACSLLEFYFTSTFDDVFHPACRHIHAFIFRRSSVLDSKSPRKSSPALLASMLCVAAETDCDEMLSWPYRRLQSVRNRLYMLTIQLLRPLVHAEYEPLAVSREDSSGGDCEMVLDVPPIRTHDHLNADSRSLHEQGTLDDIVTYIHIAAVTSASERKAASMRWWHAAFTLARELKLHVEISPKATLFPQRSTNAGPQTAIDPWTDWESFDFNTFTMDYTDAASGSSPQGSVGRPHSPLGEEEQEERRRTWWLLYIHDRHLALCYNRHLALTDAECSELLLPLDEAAWQSGSFLTSVDPFAYRPGFPSVRCTGYTAFGFLLPLMTIMGEIIDNNHGKYHPFLGEQYRMAPHADALELQIIQQLIAYKESLDGLQAMQPSQFQAGGMQSEQHDVHIRTVARYADFIIHVCYILLAGKCDPVSMFDDKDFWMLSPAFVSTKNHALEAAEALNQILDIDPDLSFMPYFMGIMLLQGSFVLLVVIDRLQAQTDPQIITACETVIRATEACVATLDADYQRKYRQILRSAVMQARGRSIPERISKDRRRAVLALYRWTRNGTGLAL
ncbi:hypothetical protein PV11_08557 [Exophiala sideris]|uniref:Zn(2)-C6 fungal-type domain-containing protein n=1 Tax=Exophiala sideris TaxID=1016849 RepID=A0A0D1VXP6_9EURO|nr:hypothetical protein PV11_08557 [Exophiala sideris]